MVVCGGVFMGFQHGCGFVGFSGRDWRGQGSSSCGGKIDMVMGGDGFTNRFWPWVWG